MQILQPKSREDESDSRGWMSQTRNIITTQLDEYHLVGILLYHNANYTYDTYVQEDAHKQRRTIRTRKARGPYRTLTTRRQEKAGPEQDTDQPLQGQGPTQSHQTTSIRWCTVHKDSNLLASSTSPHDTLACASFQRLFKEKSDHST